MRAPQIIVVCLLVGNLMIAANLHGKPREGQNNFWVSVLAQVLLFALLWWGGFWR